MTTDLVELRVHPSQFVWGRIENFYDIGERYTIAEHRRRGAESPEYSIWVDGKYTHHGTDTLDRAIILAVCLGNLSANEASCACNLVCRALCVE